MKTLVTTLTLSLLALVTVNAQAQTSTPNVSERQVHQQKRIAKGVRSGELTARETVNLERQEAKVQMDKKAAKADGVVTTEERAKLQAEENRVSRHIYNKKHNQRTQ